MLIVCHITHNLSLCRTVNIKDKIAFWFLFGKLLKKQNNPTSVLFTKKQNVYPFK